MVPSNLPCERVLPFQKRKRDERYVIFCIQINESGPSTGTRRALVQINPANMVNNPINQNKSEQIELNGIVCFFVFENRHCLTSYRLMNGQHVALFGDTRIPQII